MPLRFGDSAMQLGVLFAAAPACLTRALSRRHSRVFNRCSARMSASTGASPSSASLKLALCQIGVTASKEENLRVAADALRTASSNGAHLAVLPECFNSPYDTSCFKDYAEPLPDVGHPFASPTVSPSVQMLRETATATSMTIIGGSVPESGADGKIYNTSITVDPDGAVIAKHRKLHLFDISVPGGITFRESDALSAGSSSTSFSVALSDGGSIRVGVGICYDVRFPELAAIAAREAGAQLLVYPGAFNMTTGPAHWELLLRARALDNQLYVAACSPARNATGEGYVAWGHSTIVDPWGTVVATTDEKAGVVYGDISLERIEHVRAAVPTAMQRRDDIYQLADVQKRGKT